MLKNFEEYTQALSKREQAHAETLEHMFEGAKGNAITGQHIIATFRNDFNIVIDASTVRRLVKHLCLTSLPNLIGTKVGYFITNDPQKLKDAAKTLISRSSENQRRAEAIHRYLRRIYGINYIGE